MLTFATANVNGIRAAIRRGIGPWLESRTPDVLLLQEVRAPLTELEKALPGWKIAHQASDLAGRAGVAIATRHPVTAVRIGLADEPEPAVDTGRWVEVDLEPAPGIRLTAISAYIHSGQMGTPKMAAKYAHLDKVTARMRELSAAGGHVVVGGDMNIAHRNEDVANWRGNLKNSGLQPEERAHLDLWTGDLGFVDIARHLAGEGKAAYTWWSWRGRAFDNDTGWRIDYQFVSPSMADRAVKAEVDKARTGPERWSDHAPLLVSYDL